MKAFCWIVFGCYFMLPQALVSQHLISAELSLFLNSTDQAQAFVIYDFSATLDKPIILKADLTHSDVEINSISVNNKGSVLQTRIQDGFRTTEISNELWQNGADTSQLVATYQIKFKDNLFCPILFPNIKAQRAKPDFFTVKFFNNSGMNDLFLEFPNVEITSDTIGEYEFTMSALPSALKFTRDFQDIKSRNVLDYLLLGLLIVLIGGILIYIRKRNGGVS